MYQLDSLTYQNSGVSSTVNLLDEEIDAGYTVTVQPEEENSSEEAVPDVAVYSLSEDGNVIEASSDTENIEETVAGVWKRQILYHRLQEKREPIKRW